MLYTTQKVENLGDEEKKVQWKVLLRMYAGFMDLGRGLINIYDLLGQACTSAARHTM